MYTLLLLLPCVVFGWALVSQRPSSGGRSCTVTSGQCQRFCLQLTSCCAWPSGAGGAEGHRDLSGHLHTQLSSKDSSSIHQKEIVSFIEEGNPSLWPLCHPEIDGLKVVSPYAPDLFGDCPWTLVALAFGGPVCERHFPFKNTSYTAKIGFLKSIHCSSLI